MTTSIVLKKITPPYLLVLGFLLAELLDFLLTFFVGELLHVLQPFSLLRRARVFVLRVARLFLDWREGIVEQHINGPGRDATFISSTTPVDFQKFARVPHCNDTNTNDILHDDSDYLNAIVAWLRPRTVRRPNGHARTITRNLVLPILPILGDYRSGVVPR